MLDGAVSLVRAMIVKTPPNAGPGAFASVADWWAAWDLGRRVARMDLPGKRDLLDLFTKSAGDVLDAWFESVPLKAALGFDATVGHYASPYAPGSAYVLLHHVFGEIDGDRGVWGHAIGGMGAITQAMAKEAVARGVEITVDAPVAGRRARRSRPRARRPPRRRHVDRGATRRRERASATAVRLARRPRRAAGRLRAPDRRLSQRLGHAADERRAVGAARLRRAAGHARAAASRERHRDGAVA